MELNFDLESEACLGSTRGSGIGRSTASSGRFNPSLPQTPLMTPRYVDQSYLVQDDQFSPPILSHSVSSRASSSGRNARSYDHGSGGFHPHVTDGTHAHLEERRPDRVAPSVKSGRSCSYQERQPDMRTVGMHDHVSTGLDESTRSRYYPPSRAGLDNGPSPLDSVSMIGVPVKDRGEEYVRAQINRNAERPSAELAASLVQSSRLASPSTKRRVSMSSRRESFSGGVRDVMPCTPTVPVVSSRQRSDSGGARAPVSHVGMPPVQPGFKPPSTHYEGSILVCSPSLPTGPSTTVTTQKRHSRGSSRPSEVTAVQREPSCNTRPMHAAGQPNDASTYVSSASRMSKIVIDRAVLCDIAHTEVADDINLRTIGGHNVIVMRDGATFEVVDVNGDPVDPIYYDGADQRRSLGLPPLTPRDIHDAIKRSTNGKYGVSRDKGSYRVVVTEDSSGRNRRVVAKDASWWKKAFTPL